MGRRQNRYLRRMKKRQKPEIPYDVLLEYDNLYEAAKMSAKGVAWKASVQKYMLNILMCISKSRKELIQGKDVRRGFIEFDIIDRGKPRHISSVHFEERVVQKILCNKILYPTFSPKLIQDNYASQKGKGTHYALKQLQKHLIKYYHKYGQHGYVLLLDFKSYFASISHNKLVSLYEEQFNDKRTNKLAESFVSAYGTPGLGLGAETSQINAIMYINKVDHYIKEQLHCKWYGRYMDDCYIIHNSKEYLLEILPKIQDKLAEHNIKTHPKKTQIAKFSQGFTFLKTRFFVTETGKIIKKPCAKNITRERRKLKKQFKLVAEGKLKLAALVQSFASWHGSVKHKTARKSIYNMVQLFNKLQTNLIPS